MTQHVKLHDELCDEGATLLMAVDRHITADGVVTIEEALLRAQVGVVYALAEVMAAHVKRCVRELGGGRVDSRLLVMERDSDAALAEARMRLNRLNGAGEKRMIPISDELTGIRVEEERFAA